jgi:hypothetical protein
METIMASTAKPKTPKSKLDEVALRILKTAADRKDRLVFPLPETIAASDRDAEKVIKELLARQLIEECPAKPEDAVWRTDEQQRHLTLRVSTSGLEAVGAQYNADAATAAAEPTTAPAKARHSKPRDIKTRAAKASKISPTRQKQATKAERILALLRRPQGATIADLTKSTGWQAHSIRGFMSGTLKNKMKLKLKSERPEGKERRYRVA